MPSSGAGNFTNAPGLAGLNNPHLTQGSPCIDAGNNAYVFTATDLDGEARTNGTTVDVGCDEFWADSCTGTLQCRDSDAGRHECGGRLPPVVPGGHRGVVP